MTQTFALPVPVGWNPQDVVLGATEISYVNDGADLIPATTTHSAWGNVVSMGATGTTSIGVGTEIGILWSRPGILLRGGFVQYYKTSGSTVIQAGTTFGSPDENRAGVPLHQDPIWTVTMTAPESGTPVTVFANETRILPQGSYGAVTVFNGGRLTLISSGVYALTSLQLEPGSVVTMTAPDAPHIYVRSNLIQRTPIGRPGLVLGYLGTATVSVDRTFTGDLFMAPNANIDIKAHSTGHFFGKNVTLFEGLRVTAPVLSQRTQDLIRPADSVRVRGLISTTRAAEIGSAILTPQLNPSCGTDRVIVSYHGASVMYQSESALGTTAPATFPSLPAPSPNPSSCLSTWLPPLTPLWPIQPGGTPYYSDAGTFTDNLMTRMSGGRVVHAGFSGRRCTDSSAGIPQPAACPGAQPAGGAACNPAMLDNKACIYGATQCQCRAFCHGGADYESGLEGASCATGANCCSDTCSVPAGSTVGTCTAPSPMPATTWSCGSLDRVDAGMIGVRMSTGCGAANTWTAGAFDPSALGVTFADGALARITDRPEMFWDNFDERLYVNANVFAGGGGAGSPLAHNVIYSASTTGVVSASNLSWQAVPPAITALEDDRFLRVMTTVVDDRAALNTTPPSLGRYVHLVAARCFADEPQVQVYTPFGRKTWRLNEGDPDETTGCREALLGENGQPFSQIHFGPSIVGTSSVPPRLWVAYTGAKNAAGGGRFTIVNVYSVTLNSSASYSARPIIVREHRIDLASSGQHALWPQLIAVDGLAGSDRRLDSPVVLRWSAVGGDTVTEQAVVLYSGLLGPRRTLATWSVAATFPMTNCAAVGCFNGDYKYGAFHRKAAGTLSYFTPWTGGGIDPATMQPIGYPTASGAFVDVTP